MSALIHSTKRPREPFALIRPLTVAGVILVVAALAILGYRIAFAGRVFPGVTAAGVSLGGLTRSEAAGRLTAHLRPNVERPLVVRTESQEWRLNRAALGAHYDVDQLTAVAFSYGRTGRLLSDAIAPFLLRFSPRDVDSSVLLGDADWNVVLKPIASSIDRPAVDAKLTITPDHVVGISPDHDGYRLDLDRTKRLITAALLNPSGDVVTLRIDTIPPTTRIADLQAARDQTRALLAGPVEVSAGDRHWTLGVDQIQQSLVLPDSTANGASEGVRADPKLVEEFVDRIAADIDRPARDAALALKGTTYGLRPDQSALKVDRAATIARVQDAMASDARSVTAVVDESQAGVHDDDLAAALDRANTIVGSNLVVQGPDQRQWKLTMASLRAMIALPDATAMKNGTLPRLDPASVAAFVAKLAKDVDRDPANARFQRDPSGSVTLLRDGTTGLTVNQSDSVARIVDGATKTDRSVSLVVATVQPSVGSQDVDRLASLTLIAENSTPYGFSIPPRRHNVELATSLLNGAVVGPGEIFSFNRELGTTSLARGFQVGFGIVASGDTVKTVPAVAGGICQVATTLFQPVFWEGYTIEERYSHAYWIAHYASRGYPGLDATVDEDGGLDFQFKNDTDSPLLIQSGTDGSNVHFAVYGVQPNWTVKVDPAKITNVVKTDPKPEVQEDPTLPKGTQITTEAAEDGFQVVVHRQVVDASGNARDLYLRSSYAPAHNVVVVGTKA
jgi:vancomycin resistance protein YoaR